ncbi:tryptophan 2,3-dioxygenase [Kineosporia sp. R_H_3]|uniref:tryptophan 2,3-dioxygenase n=1 Tax=Kineosporia sp. R_H_3 TaxID=1961848 RepID=UPI000B4B4E35|nr:tryptophan 2,3-dioxygenase family protein [Kineosporia sp. R_H_3]
MTGKALTYSSYLRVDDLLALQEPRSLDPVTGETEHDEMLFIVIHQVYELWFKQLLHEASRLGTAFEGGDARTALATLTRMLTILKTVVGQVDVLETMTPLSFAGFRGRLDSASGFQSAQFRELEAVLGRRDPAMLSPHPPGPARDRIEAAMGRPGLWAQFLGFAGLAGLDGEALLDGLERVYREDALRALVCERMVDLDEGFQEWRYRHVKMVERTIGGQMGTGGSSGAAYLRSTLLRPMFPALWQVRDRF